MHIISTSIKLGVNYVQVYLVVNVLLLELYQILSF